MIGLLRNKACIYATQVGDGTYMKKITFIFCLIIATFTLEGCKDSSDLFLSFSENQEANNYNVDNNITESDFFAEDLVIIPEAENLGNDNELVAEAVLLVSVEDKKTVYANNVYEKLYPASLTKLLTALVLLKNGELTDSTTISYQASHIADPDAKICGFKEGDVISVEVLLNSLLVYSGNDAGVALAEYVGGSEEAFVEKMNEEAKRIGAVHSNFVNSHGLHDDNQYTTAYDIYLIFNELIQNDTFCSIINTDSYTAVYKDLNGNEKEKTFTTTNRYLNDKEEPPFKGLSVIGGKTGTTNKAGNCLVILCRDDTGNSYIAVILKASGNDSLYLQMSHLLSFLDKD